jgi:tetrachlorobenzoquinone reductase
MASSKQASDIAVRLCGVAYGASGINLYHFRSLDGAALPAFEPGAHIDVQISIVHRRQYSLIWPSPSEDSYTVAVQVSEAGRGGSKALHYESVVGTTFHISAPRNNFSLHPGSESYALFAGGIGITPIVSMFRSLKQAGSKVDLYYWTANPDRTLFYRELVEDRSVHLMHEARPGEPQTMISDVIRSLPETTHLYCCGPERMLDEFDAVSSSRPEGSTHRERFAAQTETLSRDVFKVYLKKSNKVLTVGPDQTLLQACIEGGVDVGYSCEEGVCGACEVAVLEGKVDHRDSVLTPFEREKGCKMMICCSRAKDESLVLDL